MASTVDAPPYTFVAKTARVSWDSVLDFDATPFTNGTDVSPRDLNALDNLARRLEEAKIEPQTGVEAANAAVNLAKLASILQLSSEYQAMRAEDLQAAVAKKDEELDMMDEQMEVMEQRGGRSDPRLEAENEELKIRAEQAERRLAEQRDELAVTQEQLDRAKRDVRDEKSKTEVALQKAKHAEDDVKELVEQIAAERQKNVRAAKDDSLAGSRLQQRNQDVARYQKENKLLADENDRMNMRIEDLMAECVEMSETIVKLDDAAQAWRGREADVEAAADGLRRERDKLAAQLETTKMDLEERTHLLQDLEIKFKEEYERFEREKEDLMIDAKRARHGEGVDGARGFDAGSGRSDLVSPRRRMQITRDPRRPANPDDPRYVEDLEAEVAELRDLRVLLLEAYDQLEHDVGREIDIALKRQRRQHDALHDKLAAQDEALDIETKRFRSIDKELTHAQEDLAEANERCKKYEAGVYGLSDAMRDLKQTRLRVRAADAQVEDAVALSNQLGRKVEDLIEETRYLRQKAGIPEDATLDLGGFKLKSQVESAQMRALNAQLEREVADLEEDRRRLRNELRYRAKWQGEHAARLGLSARQLGMLEEYADALRYGDDALFNDADDAGSHPGFRASQGIGARAIRELEDANKTLQQRLAEALDRLQRGETGAGGISMPLIAAGSYGGGDHSQVAELQSQLARARAEIVRLEDGYNVAMMRSSVQGALVGSGGGGGVASVAASPAAAARAPDSPPRGAATAAAAAAAAAPGAAVDASAYAEALETIDRLRGERNALHARARSLQSMIDAAPATMGVGASGVVAGVGGADYGASTDVQKMREECVAADRALAGVVAELQTKERELDELAHETAKYKTGIAELQAVRTALYREHVRARNAWSEERKTLLERAKRAETEAEANRIEAKDATALCERLKPGAESGLKEALSAAHSRLAVLQVREVRLSRAVEAATSAEASFRAEKEELEIDVQEMSRACQERLAFHERRAAEAELRAARCQRELDLCVPRPEHAAVVDANRALQVRFKELLETRVKSAVSSAQLKAAQEDAVTARAQADAASAANAAAQNRVRELSAALDDAADRAGREGLAASAVELRREVAETRAELEASKRLADLAKRESERLTESKADLESAVLGLEHQLAEAKARVHEAQEAERKHLSQLAVAVSEDKHRAEMEAVAAAEDEAARLRAEVVRAEDRAARAETELGRKNAAHAARDAELLQLRSAVRDMERRSDAAAALARANEDVVRLKGGNAQLKHQVQVAEAEADRLHGDCLRLHRRAQVQENRLYGLREDSRGLMQAQEAALARLETAVAGRVDLSEAEKWERAILDLRKGAERREELLRRAQETLRGAAERARAAELELASLKNIDRVAREHDGGSPDAAMREIRKLSDELMRAKLAAARAERAAKQANDRAEYLETRERERELETRQMEERALIDKRADADRAEEFSRKVRELQREILTARNVGVGDAKKDGANASATATGAADADDADAVLAAPLPRRRANAEALAAVGAAAAVGLQPGATSMETQRMVLRQIEAIRALKLRATEAEAKCARATEEARAAAAAVQNAENERDAVQRRLDATIAAGTGADGEHGTGATGDDSAVAQVTAVAQATIARLQELVGEKNAALTRAQAAMSDLRADALSKQDEDRRTIEKLNDLLFKQDQHKIDAMKEQLEYGGVLGGGGGGGGGGGRTPSKSGAGGGRGKFADKSHEQLLALLSEREQAIEVLTQRFEQQRARHEVSEARLLARAQQKEGEMDRVVAEIDRERARGPSRVLETLVARLKTQLAQKDKRLAQLKEAIRELEKKLVEAMQKQADGSIARADQRMTEVDQFKAEGADKRASTLAAQLKRAREELATAKEREALWAEERARLAAEARAARETAAKAAREAAVARSAAERTRAQSSSRAAAVAVADRAADRRDDDGVDGEVIERLSRQTADAAANAAAERERAEELEKRVAVLKTQNEKLNKLLRAEREESVAIRSGRPAERSSVSVSAATRGENEPPSGGAKESAEETRRREETLARWEEGVKLRKKAESLAKKLATRTREAEEADKLANKRLDLLNELAKEKTALQSRAAKLAEDVKRGAGGGPDAAAAKELADENEALHREIASLQRVVEVDQAAEIAKLKRRLADTPAPAAAATTTTTGRGVTGDELDATARAAAEQRVRTLEGELLAKDDAALGLRFEAEQSHARAERLQRRLDRLFRGERERDGGDGASGVAAATRRARELEDVVEALKKVVEKQQSEIAAVRGQAAAKERGIEHARAAKELRAKVRDLEQEMVGLRQLEKTHKETTQRARRLQAQNEQFRARLQSGADAEMLAAAREDAASTALRLAETRDLLVVAQRDAAAARQDALEAMDAAVRGGGGGGGDAAAEIAALRAENADLKVELDALDPAFFDEVMEMKRAYHEQSRTLDRYEATLADYAERLGVSFTPARRASGER